MAGDGVMEFGDWIIKDALKENPCVKVPEFPDELTCIVYDEHDNALEWRVYVPKGLKCSERRESQGYYLDVETIQRQQERIAELEAVVRDHEHGMREAWAEYEKRDELIRDMHRVMWACREADCPHRENGCFRVKGNGDGECWFERRMRELGIEVDDEG